MALYPLTYGCLLTLAIIMPVGAQNVFIFNQGLQHSRFFDAWPSVISATICDLILICSAIFGLTLVILQISLLKNIMLFAGGIFLCYLSYSLWNKAVIPLTEVKSYSRMKQVVYTISVSILNPHVLLDTFLIIGSNALLFTTVQSKVLFGIGCGITELLWFSFLCFAGNQLRRIPNNTLFILVINRVAAIIVFGIAAGILFNLIYPYMADS